MIKIIAFDLVGVLVKENNINLTEKEEKIEKLFGSNINDAEYLFKARQIIEKDSIIMRMTEDVISKIYTVKEENLFKKIKEKYSNIKIIIVTNHVSFIRNYIGEAFGVDYLDDLIISAEIHKIKPNADFYEHLLNKYNIKPEELLFLDDNQDIVDVASSLGINAIKVEETDNLYKLVSNYMNSD